MSAEALVKALGGRRVGSGWMARCPAHNDREPSLSILDQDGKVLVHCHAGCKQRDVIAVLTVRGLWVSAGAERQRRRFPLRTSAPQANRSQEERSAAACAVWQSTAPAAGSLVETYLASRGLKLPPAAALRFHPRLKHPSGERWPTMVALVTRGCDGAALAVHRTFLARDGRGKAPIEPAKMMLGPCRGGVVRLGQPDEVLMIGEGIETCLTAMWATGQPSWAALSTSGLRTLELPDNVREVIVLADGDGPGEAAARDCALRWKRQSRRVRIARPPLGLDFNDMLLGRAPKAEEGTR